jgi:soluble lytic murein transglycosylase
LTPVIEIFLALWSSVFGAQAAGPVLGTPTPAISTPPATYQTGHLTISDAAALEQGLRAVAGNDPSGAEAARAQISDPVAQKIIRWAEVDALGDRMAFFELEGARRDLAGWPRPATREAKAEKALETAGYDPDRTIAFFDGAPPTTPQGALALASALQIKGRLPEAQALVRHWWRGRLFDADVQARFSARFGTWLTPEDNDARLDLLILGDRTAAITQIKPSLDQTHREFADAIDVIQTMLRKDRGHAAGYLASTPLPHDPAYAYVWAREFHHNGQDESGFAFLADLPPAPEDEELADKLWTLRKAYFNTAVKDHNWAAAYAAMDKAGFTTGEHRAEAEFFAGWIALTKQKDPAIADRHFAAVADAGSSPITQARASYWRGRAAEARGDTAGAQSFYTSGSKFLTTFYGQLSAEKAGLKTLTLGADPVPTEADRQRFDLREVVRAARLLHDAGQREYFRIFVLSAAQNLANGEEYALLVDLARDAGDQDLSMRVARAGAQRGFILPGRGYPVLPVPSDPGAAEPAFVLSITRQESNFWPMARSSANARGMMQLIPATARHDAAQLGLAYSESRLWDPSFNMRVGAWELGQMVSTFGGSYAMAAAAYNAGPNRPPLWVGQCVDPRATDSDPLDFVECIPFTETRNYVMRTLETMEVYRAKLNGGSAPLTLAEDLKRGVYGYTATPTAATPSAPVPYDKLAGSSDVPTSPNGGPVPYDNLPLAPARVESSSQPPEPVSTHSASSRKTSAKTSRLKASRKAPSAARHPASRTRTRSAKRPAKPRS